MIRSISDQWTTDTSNDNKYDFKIFDDLDIGYDESYDRMTSQFNSSENNDLKYLYYLYLFLSNALQKKIIE